jgi:PTS system N-acetylglucosamine-specific IIC component
MFMRVDVSEVSPAFAKIDNQFIGIVCGLLGAACYNRFKDTKLRDALSFFSGKRCVAIVTACFTLVATLILFFLWPVLYTALVSFGRAIISTGAIGAGIYALLNRLLIPLGLHHALNSVFWFDIAGINDIARFWGQAEGGVIGQTGMYMTGFFPVMMFGLPAAALAMYRSAKPDRKKSAGGLLISGALASIFTGITEPLEFSFMFLAPVLYLAHALLTGLSAFVCALLPVRSGFNFSAGFVDWFLSFKAPMAQNPLFLIPVGAVFAILYYFLFRVMIVNLGLKTPGREDDGGGNDEKSATLASGDFGAIAGTILEGLGGVENITGIDNCITRLRVEVKNYESVSEKKIKSAGVAGVIRPGKTSVQVVIGTKVQFVADEIRRRIEGREERK